MDHIYGTECIYILWIRLYSYLFTTKKIVRIELVCCNICDRVITCSESWTLTAFGFTSERACTRALIDAVAASLERPLSLSLSLSLCLSVSFSLSLSQSALPSESGLDITVAKAERERERERERAVLKHSSGVCSFVRRSHCSIAALSAVRALLVAPPPSPSSVRPFLISLPHSHSHSLPLASTPPPSMI